MSFERRYRIFEKSADGRSASVSDYMSVWGVLRFLLFGKKEFHVEIFSDEEQ